MKYIQINSDWVNTITLEPKDFLEHLKENYIYCFEDWSENKEKLTISIVEMTEREFNELPEWQP